MKNIYFISEGRMYISPLEGNTAEREIDSNIYRTYLERKKRRAGMNEWKTSGSGAAFSGNFTPGTDAESEVRNTKMKISCVRPVKKGIVYSMSIDEASGIYTRPDINDPDCTEGFVISDANDAYGAFDIKNGNYAVTVEFAGESHIGIIRNKENGCQILTDGFTREENPSWSEDGRTVYAESCGLAREKENGNTDPIRGGNMSTFELMMLMSNGGYTPFIKGPSSIISIDTLRTDVDYVISDDNFSFIKPQCSGGYLYFIKKPYRENTDSTSLKDKATAPVRFFKGIFGWMNIFTMKYSGEPMVKGGDVKNRDQEKIYIDGNLIKAEEALEENRKSNEKFPGIIPKSYELCRMKLGTEKAEVIKRGVIAYCIDPETGYIYYSNGEGIIMLTPDGDEEKISSIKKVSFISLK